MADLLHDLLASLPKALAFVAVLVAGWLAARLVRTAVGRLLVRVGFDRVVERGGVGAALARSQHDAGDLVARTAQYAVLLFALQAAFGIWGPNPVSDLLTRVIAWLPRAFVAIVIVVVAAAIARGVRDIVAGALGGLAYGALLARIGSTVVLGLGAIAALNQVGVATTVTMPVLIAVLATIGGVIVVGVGGGLIKPMQDRWASWLDRAERAVPDIAEQARAYEQGRRDAAVAQAARREEVAAREAAGRVAAEMADLEATQVISAAQTQRLPDGIPNQ